MLPHVDVPFVYAAGLTGASIDELKMIASFLLSYPFAGILKRVPDSKPWLKNLFIIGISAFYFVGLFDLWDGLQTILISSSGAYLIAYYLDGSLMPWIGFIFLMTHMSINHIQRQIVDAPHTVDVTGAQMVLVMKLTAFCWNVYDGRLDPKEMTDFQKKNAIYEMPGVLDYAGYVLFFPSLFAGPSFDYVEYRHWIDTSMFKVPPGTDPSHIPRTRKQRRIPRSGTPATRKAIAGLVWIFAFLQLGSRYNPALILGDEFTKYSFFRRLWLLHMVGFTTRTKYYGVWHLTEGACILSGLGYNGIDAKSGKVKWDRLQNVTPWSIESAQNTRGYLEGWNINTNHWLRYYMYLRVTPKGKKPGFTASMATFLTSALWHGFYPGYYLAFVLAAFLQTVARNGRRLIRPFFLTAAGAPTPYKKYYDFLTFIITQMAFDFTVVPFILLSFSSTWTVWSRMHFYLLHVIALSILVFSSRHTKALLKSELERRVQPTKKAPSELKRVDSEGKFEFIGTGLPSDPAGDLEVVMEDLRKEVEVRRRRGSIVSMPTGLELKKAIEDRLRRR